MPYGFKSREITAAMDQCVASTRFTHVKTRKGRIIKLKRQVYARSDIPCGIEACNGECGGGISTQAVSLSSETVLIPDAVLLARNWTFLKDNADAGSVLLLSSTLGYLKDVSPGVFHKLYKYVTSPENTRFVVFQDQFHAGSHTIPLDGEDGLSLTRRSSRVAARWYIQSHKHTSARFLMLFLSDSEVQVATLEGLNAMGLNAFVEKHHPELISYVESCSDDSILAVKNGGNHTTHLTKLQMDSAVKDTEAYVLGKLFMSKGASRGRVMKSDSSEILLEGHACLNRAIHQDTVLVSLKGELPAVVGIYSRPWKQVCGSIDRDGSHGVVVPIDPRYPKVTIKSRRLEELIGKRIVVTIDKWESGRSTPDGHLIRVIGPIGDRDVETQVVLIEHEVPNEEFSEQVYKCLPPIDWTVVPQQLEPFTDRKDLRSLRVFSIDPPSCQDIDDALHVRVLDNGNFELGVHIADVGSFIQPGSPLDHEASNRSTSVYLVDQRIDMIPKLLSTDVCSLHEGVDRFAFSVIWELSPLPALEVVNVKFHRSAIHSVAALAYSDAQAMLDGQPHQLAEDVKMLGAIARELRGRRMEAGALTLASPEVKFKVEEETSDPTDISVYELKEANRMIEEFMLFANIAVANKILESYPSQALLRKHPIPPSARFEKLVKQASAAGIVIDVSSSKTLSESLETAKPESVQYLLRIMATRCMLQAVYFMSGETSDSTDYYHYGLAAPLYTHFTSPIRRYADLIVHRLLAASIGIEKLPIDLLDVEQMAEKVDRLNHRTRMAQLAGRSSVELFKVLFFKSRGGIPKCTAVISGISATKLDVFIAEFGIEGSVELPESEDVIYEEDSEFEIEIHGQKLRIFDEVTITISICEASGNREYVKFELFQGDSETQTHKKARID